jgi:hypothetical protein
MLFTSERQGGGPTISIQALNGTVTGTEMSDVGKENLLSNEVEVMTYFINDENMKNCPHIDIGMEL